MEKLEITTFNKGLISLDEDIICSVEEVIKLGLLGYLTNDSELQLCQYLVLRETKILGGLVDYKLENHRLRYKGQTVDVKLKVPEGVVDLDWCFENTGIEVLRLRGKNVVDLCSLVESCKLLKEVFIDIVFSDDVIDLRWCFPHTKCLERVIFSKAASRAKISYMFWGSGIKEIRLSEYVLTVEDVAFDCFCGCEKLESLDCSGVTFNKGIDCILRDNPKLETISFRDCWFEDRVELINGRFLRPVTIDLRGARCKGLEKVKSLRVERGSSKEVDEFIKQFELEKVTLILD